MQLTPRRVLSFIGSSPFARAQAARVLVASSIGFAPSCSGDKPADLAAGGTQAQPVGSAGETGTNPGGGGGGGGGTAQGEGGTGGVLLGSGGAGGTNAAAGGSGAAPELLGTPTRPQLTAALAEEQTVLRYLAQAGNLAAGLQVDNWDPTAGVGDVATFTPGFRVATTGGTHTTVQEAISAAVLLGGTERQYIEVSADTYREVVCVPSNAPPITLYGSNPDASQTVIVFDNYSGKPKAAGVTANPCNANLDGTTFGTSGSATFAAYARDFHAKNLSFVNDTDEATAEAAMPDVAVQGVALMTQGDRLIFENVRALGHQDTLFVKTPNVGTVVRAYFKGCYVEGDTDFIFGRGTFVLDGCTIHSLTSRTAGGVIVAPSTPWQNPYGILITNGTFTADATAGVSSTHLGRAWDESQQNPATYAMNVASGIYPNGQAVIRQSILGAHIQSAAPWRAAATTSRAYSSTAGAYPANRFFEFENTGPGSAPP